MGVIEVGDDMGEGDDAGDEDSEGGEVDPLDLFNKTEHDKKLKEGWRTIDETTLCLCTARCPTKLTNGPRQEGIGCLPR